MRVFKTPLEQSQSFLTPKGRRMLDTANKYGIGKWYDEKSGTYQIPHSDYQLHQQKINKFLNENKNYGIDDSDNEFMILYDLGEQ